MDRPLSGRSYFWLDLRWEEQIRGVLRGHHKILSCINHNRCTAQTYQIQLVVLRKSIAVLFGLLTAILQSCNQRSTEWQLCPQVAVAQCRLAERRYVGRVFRLEHQPDVAGDCWHGVHAQAEAKWKVHPLLACHKKSMWMSGRVYESCVKEVGRPPADSVMLWGCTVWSWVPRLIRYRRSERTPRKTAPVDLFSTKLLLTLARRPARCRFLLRSDSEAQHTAVSRCSLRLPS